MRSFQLKEMCVNFLNISLENCLIFLGGGEVEKLRQNCETSKSVWWQTEQSSIY